ncbi:MAG TPA: YicC/YloC family endoribonuclease [Fibrobacteria bacterium]|nr:YicC/YloC family endoribonuclease [Fibrobacteria bacterium]
MAVQSMTGYGKADAVGAGYSVTVELKSVNNRFLEFQIRASKSILHLEPKLKTELGKHVSRGSVTCHVQYESDGPGGGGLALNETMFKAYSSVIRDAQARLGTPTVLDIADLLKIPDMVTSSEASESADVAVERILPVFERACRELVAMRETEGRVLAADMEARIRAFFPGLEKVKGLVPVRQQEYVAKMKARVQELIGDAALSQDRMVTEIGIMAERLDVTEEIVRLEAHLNHFLETMASHKGPGKRLGFLLQEMLREVNTLGTKSQFSDMQHLCVAWKEELEIVREQIQNIE